MNPLWPWRGRRPSADAPGCRSTTMSADVAAALPARQVGIQQRLQVQMARPRERLELERVEFYAHLRTQVLDSQPLASGLTDSGDRHDRELAPEDDGLGRPTYRGLPVVLGYGRLISHV